MNMSNRQPLPNHHIDILKKWRWIREYCKRNGLLAANPEDWHKAEIEYNKQEV